MDEPLAVLIEKVEKYEKIKKMMKESQAKYYSNNREKLNEYQRRKQREYYEKRKHDPEYLKKRCENVKRHNARKKVEKMQNLEIS